MIKLNDKHLDLLSVAVRPNTELLVLEGTIRSSKTVMAIQAFYFRVKTSNARLHCIAGKDYDSIRDNILEVDGFGLLDLFPDVQLIKPKIGSHYLRLNGTDGKEKIILLAGYSKKDQWKKILGKTIGTFLIDEVNIADETFIDETFGRQASVDFPFQIWTLNGDDPKHFIYQKYINRCKRLWNVPNSIITEMDKFPDKPNSYYTHWTMLDNPAMTPEKIERAKLLYPAGSYYYKIKILGERGIAEGLIYQIFASNIDSYTIKQVPQLQQIIIGVDFGGNGSGHSFSAVGYTPNNKQVILLESEWIDAKDMTPDVLYDNFELFVSKIISKYGARAMECRCDSAEQTLISGMKNRVTSKGIPVFIRNAMKKPINDRINYELMLFATGRLKVTEWNIRTIDAFRQAVYDSRKGHENERLDNGTTDIDTLDSNEYAMEPMMRDIMVLMEVK